MLRPRFLNLEQALLAHYVQLPRVASMDCRPEYVDLALMEECKTMADVPADQTVTREDFACIVPTLAAPWEQERKDKLLAALSKCIPPVAIDVTVPRLRYLPMHSLQQPQRVPLLPLPRRARAPVRALAARDGPLA